MASVKKIANPLGDEGSQETFRTLTVLKQTEADINQLIKLTRAHHQATQAAIDTGKQVVDFLVKLTTKMDGRLSDVSTTLIEISSTEKTIFQKAEEHNNTVQDLLARDLQVIIQTERTELQLFEKNYHKRHSELIAQVRRAEKETKKSGKKAPAQLQQAIADLTNSMNEITNHRQQKLEEILRLERKRYCHVANALTNMIDSQVGLCGATSQTLTDQVGRWKTVAQSSDKLPQAAQNLVQQVGVKERTSTAIHHIQGGDLSGSIYYDESYDESYNEGYYDESYYEEGYYEEGYEEGYDEGYYEEAAQPEPPKPKAAAYGGVGLKLPSIATPPASRANSGPPGSFKARALYDYTGTHSYELSFSAGDVITVTKEDPATGWWTGELHGVVGPFPGNYVERM